MIKKIDIIIAMVVASIYVLFVFKALDQYKHELYFLASTTTISYFIYRTSTQLRGIYLVLLSIVYSFFMAISICYVAMWIVMGKPSIEAYKVLIIFIIISSILIVINTLKNDTTSKSNP